MRTSKQMRSRIVRLDFSKKQSQPLLTVILCCLLLATSTVADPMETLMKIKKAAENLSFSGSFVYSHDNKLEAMEVVRRIKNGMMNERLYALNGEPREIIRNGKELWCYIPDQKMGVHQTRQLSDGGFPAMLPADLHKLNKVYSFEEGGKMRIAGRMTREIKVKPRDGYRYGYSLWADDETGLLLSSDLFDENNHLIEQYMFIDIDINPDISDQQLKAISEKSKLTWYTETDERWSDDASATRNWSFDKLPAGYDVVRHIKRIDTMKNRKVEHFVITDGMSSISVFIKKSADQSGAKHSPINNQMMGLSKMGAVHAYHKIRDEHHISVIGEVPAQTVEFLSAKIRIEK